MKPANTPRKHRLLIHIEPEQYDRLVTLKEETGAPIGELVRRILAAHFAASDAKRKE